MFTFAQITDNINCGIVVIDRDFKVTYWNRWMEIHSGLENHAVIGRVIFDIYQDLNNPQFIRNCRSVMSFGNFIFISQKLHQYLFPLKPIGSLSNLNNQDAEIEYMQQSCAMFPLRDENNLITAVCITVYDMTEIVLYQQKLLNLSRTDLLTGLYNRRYLEERLREEWDRHKRHGRPFSVVIFDIDHFKSINDTFGHLHGDRVIKMVATVASENIRDIDIIGRYGGEEFCILLPDTYLSAAVIVAERLRRAIEQNSIDIKGHMINITVSAGVAEMTENMEDSEELIKLADSALYRAKNTGRNRVATAG